ncbi:MAG: hypothetical protein V4568_04680 [Pseudomonadota bacterium]
MAKGQVRSNREQKKPKQEKKPTAPASPFGSVAGKTGSGASDKKK